MQTITPFIWFNGVAEEAMNYYVSLFDDSKIIHIERYSGDQGIPGENELASKVLTGEFELAGHRFLCLDGGQEFAPSGVVSLFVEFDTQEAIDKVWNGLIEGGKPLQCGWITDRFGVTWQIVPRVMGTMMSNPHTTEAQKKALMQAMMPMEKLEIAPLVAAFESAKN